MRVSYSKFWSCSPCPAPHLHLPTHPTSTFSFFFFCKPILSNLLPNYSWVWALPWNAADLPGIMQLKNPTLSSSSYSYQMLTTLGLLVRFYAPIPQAGCLELVQFCACYHRCCESVWYCPVVFWEHCVFDVICHLGAYTLSPFFLEDPDPRGKECDINIPFRYFTEHPSLLLSAWWPAEDLCANCLLLRKLVWEAGRCPHWWGEPRVIRGRFNTVSIWQNSSARFSLGAV